MNRRLLLAAMAASAAAAALPSVAHAEPATTATPMGEGRLVRNLAMPSRILGMDVLYTLYLPPGYGRPGGSYPVTHLLHGGSNTNVTWAEKGDIKKIMDTAILRKRIAPMLVVMPDARRDQTRPAEGQQNTFNMNDLDGKFRYADMFVEEFVPFIESTYDVRPGVRGIGGLSMGGYGALMFAMSNPGLFAGAVGLSAGHRTDQQIVELDMEGYNRRYGKAWGENLVGRERLNDAYHHYNLREIINRTPKTDLEKTQYYMDVGAYDEFFEGNAQLHVQLTKKAVAHRFMSREGGHDWPYWQSAMPSALEFLDGAYTKATG